MLSVFKLAKSSQGTRLRISEVLATLICAVGEFGKADVLECGCGAGAYSNAISRNFKSVCAFDINPKLVEAARANVKAVHFFIGDVQDMAVKENRFDIVLMADVIEHLKDPDKAIKNANSVLRKNGILAATVPSARWGLLYKFFSMRKEEIGHYNLYDFKGLGDIFRRNGFDVLSHKMIQSYPSAFIDTFIAKLSLIRLGSKKVLDSEMSVEASKSGLLSYLYLFLNFLVYPFIIVLEKILPSRCKVEHLIIFQKVI
jgi:SAM-dependent methyltransferase